MANCWEELCSRFFEEHKCESLKRGNSIGGSHSVLTGIVRLVEFVNLPEMLTLLNCDAKVSFMQLVEWRLVDSDPLIEGTEAYEIARKLRIIKNLDPNIPGIDRFSDKL